MTKKLLKSVLLSLALATSLAPTAILAEEQSQQDNTSSVESISKLREEAKKEVYNEGKSQRVGSDLTGWVNVPEDFKEFTKYKEENEGRLLQYDRNNEDVVVTLEKLDAYPREKVAEFMKKATDLELHAKDKVFHVNSTLTPYLLLMKPSESRQNTGQTTIPTYLAKSSTMSSHQMTKKINTMWYQSYLISQMTPSSRTKQSQSSRPGHLENKSKATGNAGRFFVEWSFWLFSSFRAFFPVSGRASGLLFKLVHWLLAFSRFSGLFHGFWPS